MPPDLLLNTILADFQNAMDGDYPALLSYGALILSSIGVLGLGVAWARAGFDTSLHTILRNVLMSIIMVGLVYAVMEHIQDWGGAIIQTGQIVGNGVSGVALTPSQFYATGMNLVDTLDSARGWALWLIGILNLSDLVWFVMAEAIQFVWLAASLIYLWVLLEATALITLAPVILCWSAVEFTWPIIYAWPGRLLYVAVKTIAMMVVLAVLMSEAAAWADELNSLGWTLNLHFFAYLGQVLSESVVVFVMVWKLPNSIAELIRTQVGAGGSISQGAEQIAGYARSAAATALTAVTQPAETTAAYVSRKLLS